MRVRPQGKRGALRRLRDLQVLLTCGGVRDVPQRLDQVEIGRAPSVLTDGNNKIHVLGIRKGAKAIYNIRWVFEPHHGNQHF